VSSDPARRHPGRSWAPHPDDEADLRDASAAAERGELLTADATESFLRWLDGSGDDAWRGELD